MIKGPARKMARIENISVGLKWTSRPCLRFLFYFFKHMKAALAELITFIFDFLFSILYLVFYLLFILYL